MSAIHPLRTFVSRIGWEVERLSMSVFGRSTKPSYQAVTPARPVQVGLVYVNNRGMVSETGLAFSISMAFVAAILRVL
jgi:hypothetical protein